MIALPSGEPLMALSVPRRRFGGERKEALVGWAFLAPAFLHLLVFALIPMAYALYLSFFKIHLVRDERQFVGAFNYKYIFGDERFWNAMWNSARYALMSVPLGM